MPALDLEDRTILVTGGGRGIGREITRQMVDLGATVIVVGPNQHELDRISNEHPEKVVGLRTDLSDPLQVDALIAIEPELPRNIGAGEHCRSAVRS